MVFLVWSGGHRKALFQDIKNAKLARKSRDKNIQNEYFKKIENIEKGYKRGQLLSKKDDYRENKADEKARSDWAKSKKIYKMEVKAAKNKYKNRVKPINDSIKKSGKQKLSKAKPYIKKGALIVGGIVGAGIAGTVASAKLRDRGLSRLSTSFNNDVYNILNRRF